MMRKSLLVFGLLAIVCLFGSQAAHGCSGWWTARPCYYVASPCYYVPTCSWTCCAPCCGWSCCYYSCSPCRCYSVAPYQDVSGCSSCAPAAPSPSGASVNPIPERGAAPPSK